MRAQSVESIDPSVEDGGYVVALDEGRGPPMMGVPTQPVMRDLEVSETTFTGPDLTILLGRGYGVRGVSLTGELFPLTR